MKHVIFLWLLIPITFVGISQQITYYNDVQPIIRKNCTICHNKSQGVAPFQLGSYKDVVSKSNTILYVCEKGIMPPWKADTTFSRFKDERILSASDVDIIKRWIENGMVKGKHKRIDEKSINYKTIV